LEFVVDVVWRWSCTEDVIEIARACGFHDLDECEYVEEVVHVVASCGVSRLVAVSTVCCAVFGLECCCLLCQQRRDEIESWAIEIIFLFSIFLILQQNNKMRKIHTYNL